MLLGMLTPQNYAIGYDRMYMRKI